MNGSRILIVSRSSHISRRMFARLFAMSEFRENKSEIVQRTSHMKIFMCLFVSITLFVVGNDTLYAGNIDCNWWKAIIFCLPFVAFSSDNHLLCLCHG